MVTVKDYREFTAKRDAKIRVENGIPEGAPIPKDVYEKYVTVSEYRNDTFKENAVLTGAGVIALALILFLVWRFGKKAVTRLLATSIKTKRATVAFSKDIFRDATEEANKAK